MQIKLTLCQGKACPTLEVINGVYIIKDDFGGKVRLTREQIEILVQKYPKLCGAGLHNN